MSDEENGEDFYEDFKELQEEQLKSKLRTQIIRAIKNKSEFNYLEKMCEANKIPFSKKITNYCLDRYIYHRGQGSEQFVSKYAAMFTTCWWIMYEK